MGLFRNWILNRAEKIKAKEEAIRATKISIQLEQAAKEKEHRLAIKGEIYKMINEHAEVFKQQPEHISVGDKAIMNYYSMGRNGRNGWDGGVTSLLRNIPEEERTKPVIVEITDLYVDFSHADEFVDRFFNNHSDIWLYENIKVEKSAQFYLIWRTNLLNNYNSMLNIKTDSPVEYDKNKLTGLYKTAKFKYDGSFKPKWGLNIDSFLKEGTTEYDKTYELWSREIEINRKLKELNEKKKVLNDEMKAIDEEYKHIRFFE